MVGKGKIFHPLKKFIKKNIFGSRRYRRTEEFTRRFPRTDIHWTCNIANKGFIEIGKGSYMGENSKILSWHDKDIVRIGKYCSIAGEVIIINGGDHNLDQVSTYNPFFKMLPDRTCNSKKSLTEIGNDVWIATRALIVGPVKIGNGATVGAGAVVVSDVEPYSIVAGVPARKIGRRTTPEQAEKLQKIAWWDWPDEKIQANLEDLVGPVPEFLDKYHLE